MEQGKLAPVQLCTATGAYDFYVECREDRQCDVSKQPKAYHDGGMMFGLDS